MVTTVIPELGGGWTSDIEGKLALALAHALAADASQSNIYAGSITSIPSIIHRYQHETDLMSSEMEIKLREYLDRLFDSSKVSVEVIPSLETNNYSLLLQLEVTTQGITKTLSKELYVKDGTLNKTINEVNR